MDWKSNKKNQNNCIELNFFFRFLRASDCLQCLSPKKTHNGHVRLSMRYKTAFLPLKLENKHML